MGGRRTVPVAVGVAAALLTACAADTGDANGSPDPDGPYYDVLRDDDATADEIVEVAEGVADAARSEDGSTLLVFRIRDQEGGETEKAAWRLLDPDGVVVRSGRAPWRASATGATDGFLLVGGAQEDDLAWVDRSGEQRRVDVESGRDPVRRGDVLVADVDVPLVLRPGDGTVHRVPDVPGAEGVVPTVAVDPATGTLWAVGVGDDLRRSADGGRSWDELPLRVPDRAAPLELAAGGGTAVVALVEGFAQEPDGTSDDELRSLVVARAGEVRAVGDDALPLDDLGSPLVVVLPDGRVVVEGRSSEPDEDAGPWRARPTDDPAFDRLAPPPGSTLDLDGGTLFAVGGRTFASSSDGGATWVDEPDGR